MISEDDSICPVCQSRLAYRDSRRRIHKLAGGKVHWYIIRRLKCTNARCSRLHNELPDCIVPYKHYGTELIEDVLDEVITCDDPETENYPCEATMKHWKWWLQGNNESVSGQMKSAAYCHLDFKEEFLKSRESLLEELRKRISPGWLSVIIRFIYNAGGLIEAYPAG